MPRKPSKKALAESVVVLETHVGQPLIIRANPDDAAVRSFVKEHTRRYIAGEPCGPSGDPSFRIFNAKRYLTELDFLSGAAPAAEIDVSDLLPAQ